MPQEFCEVENVDPAAHANWLAKHGFNESDGKFSLDKYEGKQPLTADKLFENIRQNVTANQYQPLQAVPYDERVFVMVCGGPSLADHLEDVKAKAEQPDRYLVVCSNMTGDYLREHGITPHAHFVIDPQPKKSRDVANASPDVQYWINLACDPSVFQTLVDQGITPYGFLADFDADGNAIRAVKESMQNGQSGMMAIQGGTMAGLRAINLADALGFRSMQFYGFDATVQVGNGKARPYAYEKKRGEAIIEVFCDVCPDRFDTTLVFQSQVNEFLKWRSRMPWVDIEIIGGGLISHAFEHLKERERALPWSKERFTEEYKALQLDLHGKGDYGYSGITYIPTIFHAIAQLAKKHGSVDVLDYGAAGGHTMKAVREHMWLPPVVTDRCYDPFVDEFAAEPTAADLIICTDVLEHVEPECTMAVLDHLASLTKKMVFLSIALKRAQKVLADGRNAHLNLPGEEFWLKELKKRFVLSEAKIQGEGDALLVVGQSVEDVKIIMRERNAR